MSIYDVNTDQLASDLTPPKKRKPKFLSYIRAILTPLQQKIDETFLTFRPDIREQAKYNGQKIVLEGVLNKVFGVTVAPFITIDNLTFDDNGFFIPESDLDGSVSSVGDGGDNVSFIGVDYAIGDVNFNVNVPVGLGLTEEQVRTIVDKYRIYGTIYTVTFF